MKAERKEIIERHLKEGRITVILSEGKVFYKSGKECKSKDPSGYYIVGIREGKNNYTYRVHEVIAVVMGLDVLGKDINHIDGVKTNNKPNNLEAITKKDNLLHAASTGLNKEIGSGHITRCVITQEIADEIRMLIAQGVSYTTISEKYGIAKCTISNIKHHRRWNNKK